MWDGFYLFLQGVSVTCSFMSFYFNIYVVGWVITMYYYCLVLWLLQIWGSGWFGCGVFFVLFFCVSCFGS